MQSYLPLRAFASKSGPRSFNLVHKKSDNMQKVHPNVKAAIDQQMQPESFILSNPNGEE